MTEATPTIVQHTTWAEASAGIVRTCEVASMLGKSVEWNSEGAAALGKLIEKMADKLDWSVTEITRLQSELNTALERVKVLEAVVKDIAGISLSNPRNVEASLEYAVGEARAVIQSEGK